MNFQSLKEMVAAGEGPTLEFKKSTGELRQAMESLCGMLNHQGEGKVLFGVTPKGDVRGQMVADKTLEDIANATRLIDPKAEFATTRVPVGNGLDVIVVTVSSGQTPGPFTFDGRPHLRVNNTTQRMSHAELDHRVASRLENQVPWDRWIAPHWDLADLDQDEIHRTLERAVDAERLTGALGEKPETILRRLELVTDQGVTRAAAILFGKEGGPGYPLGEVRLARFNGITKDEFRDNRQFKGNAFVLLEHTQRFLDDYMPVAGRFVAGKMERIDTPLYPPLALREAIVNALVHRDYSVDGGAVSVAFFDDRLEVWSTGTLPAGLTPKKLKGTHESHPRNRLIADVFYRRGLIERWGRGTNKILAEAKKAGCPEPEFLETTGSFVVRFKPAATPALKNPPLALGPRAEKILQILGRSQTLTGPVLLHKLGERITLRALQKELKRLIDTGKITTTGKTKARSYRLAK